MWDTVSLRTMAATYHSTRTSFFRCLSLFQETGLLEPTPTIINDPLPLEPPPSPLSTLDIQAHFSSGLIAHRVQNSSRVSDRESVELHRFFGVIHADRKSTTMVSFHFQNIVRFREKKKEKLVGHRFSFSLSLSFRCRR